MKNCSPIAAPIIKGDKFSLNQCPQNALEKEQMEGIPYASVVGSLMYAQVYTRLHIAFAVGMFGNVWQISKSLDIQTLIWVDAKTLVNLLTSGYIFLLAGGAVSWRRVKQTIVATSPMEAEFMACYEATSQAL
ncbi:secreted RxLR effector protein 161-like [Lycium barbarum]|uniref:secreted RxLR effector protein 161-like n=1 Tax=Lycium barbarum TaxID=112863 RepID=UPI00293E72E1|nr:secreted RxLR effector protein 161-like [Lycium barbarum]